MMRLLVVCAAAVTIGSASFDAQNAPTAADLRRVAHEYAASYAPRISGMTLEETFTLRDVSGGRVNASRQIASDVVLLNLAGKVIALRDPFSVDSNSLRERSPRITTVLAKPSDDSWNKAQEYAAEHLRYFQDELIVRLNDPVLALQFVAPEVQTRVSYKVDGRKRIAGVETLGLAFDEPRTEAADYVIATPGKARASGKLWVEAATGRILRTELTMESATETARVAVDYSRNAALDVWLPSSMTANYDITERVGTGISNMGAGSSGIARRSYECRASYANPRMTPIDLSVSK